jgi:acyl transferase domain-containing protein
LGGITTLSQLTLHEIHQVPPNAVTIEIAPTGLLQAIIKRTLANTGCVNVSLMSAKADDQLEHMLMQLGRIYQAGVTVNVGELYPPLLMPVRLEIKFMCYSYITGPSWHAHDCPSHQMGPLCRLAGGERAWRG